MRVNDLLFRLVLAVLVLAPLPLGGQRPWAWTLLALLIGLLLIAWSLLALTGRGRAALSLAALAPIAAPFILVFAWALIQTLPGLPAAWWHPLWIEAGGALVADATQGEAVRGTLSLDPAAGRTGLLRLLSYAGMFWLALQLGRDRARARLGLRVLAGAGVAYAVFGLTLYFAGIETVLWYPKWAYLGDLTATFVNRNAYGAYAGLGALCCLALFARASRARPDQGARAAAERVFLGAAPAAIGTGILATALLLSHSRGAFLATGIAGLLLLILLAGARVVSGRLAVLLTVTLLGLGGGIVAVSGDATLGRLAESTELEGDRGQLFRLTIDAISDAPWTGHGLGSFPATFRIYRDSSMPRDVVYDFAHNLHLELALDLGIPAALLLACGYGAIGLRCLGGVIRRRRDQIHPALALAALCLLGVHGLVDFSAQMPAIALTLAYLLGVGVAQSWRSGEGRAESASSLE